MKDVMTDTQLDSIDQSRWRFSFILQRPVTGSRWFRGNFSLGLMVDSHPRFVHLIIGLVFVEFGCGWVKR